MLRISVMTPLQSGAEALPKLYASLVVQSIQNFEWIIVDDNTDDNTEEIIQEILDQAPFPVTYARYEQRVGKSSVDNTLLDLAQGDKVIWCQPDEHLISSALEILLNFWDDIPTEEQDKYISVIALSEDENGTAKTSSLQYFKSMNFSWKDALTFHKKTTNSCFMLNRKLLDNARFLEIDLDIPEEMFWQQFQYKQVISIPNVLKVIPKRTDNPTYEAPKIKHSRGKAYTILHMDKKGFLENSFKKQLDIASHLIRYAIHGDLDLAWINKEFGAPSKQFSFRLGTVLGKGYALRDRFQKRVEKTHLLFDQGKGTRPKVVKINRFKESDKKHH